MKQAAPRGRELESANDTYAMAPPGMALNVSVRRLSLTDFRNYPFVRLETDGRPVVITGPNGAGKTNLLEALSFLVPGRGLRRASLVDIGRRGGGSDVNEAPPREWAVAARLEREGTMFELGTGCRQAAGEGERARRIVKIEGETAKSQSELAHYVSAQWLTPQMDRLFIDGPSARRSFLDRLITGFDPDHAGPVAAFEQSLRNRNKLLRDGSSDAGWLDRIEESLASHAIAVSVRRSEAVERLQPAVFRGHGPFPGARIRLEGKLEQWLASGPALSAEDRMRQELRANRASDAASGGTSIGPHRSDLAVHHASTDIEASQCSTGEQKALLVAIILAAAEIQAEERGFAPLLLLDEVAAHLDEARRDALFGHICELGSQAWLTGTDERIFTSLAKQAQWFHIDNGDVTPVN